MQNKTVLQSNNALPDGASLCAQMLAPEQQELLTNVETWLQRGESIIAIFGATGSGKTTIAKALAQRSIKNQDKVLIDADITLDTSNILSNLSHLDGFNPSLLLDRSDESEQLKRWLTARQEQGKSLVVIIDQTEQLNSDVLTELVSLSSQASGLSLVLLCLEGYADKLGTGEHQSLVCQIEMPLLSESSALILLKQVYSPDLPLPLTDLELNTVYVESQGLPGPLLMKAADLLLSADKSSSTLGKHWLSFLTVKEYFPTTHLFILAILLGGIFIVLLFELSKDNEITGLNKSTLKEELAKPSSELSNSLPQQTEDSSDSITNANVSMFDEQTVATNVQVPTLNERAGDEAESIAESGFVIQLFGGYEESNAVDFISSDTGKLVKNNLFVYKTNNNGRPWFVVVTEVYPTKQAAEQQIKSWPRELRVLSPWIRNIKSVQKTTL